LAQLDEALIVEKSKVNLKRSYADKFNEVLPAAKAARYLQIETKIRSLLRLELARNIRWFLKASEQSPYFSARSCDF